MAERRRPNARTRARRSYQPALPKDVRAAMSTGHEHGARTEQQELNKWTRRVSQARKLREQWEQRYMVETLERFYLGQHTQLGTDQPAEIWLNHFAATLQTQRPALLPTKLTYEAQQRPGQPAQERLKVKVLGGLLDTIAQQDNHLMKSLRLAATQAFFRIGVLKSCYEPEMEPNPDAGEPLFNEEDQALLGEDGAGVTQPAELMTDEVYRWRWVNARNMLLPDEGPDQTTWSWIGEEIEVSLEKAKNDTRFPESKRKVLKANGKPRDLEGATRTREEDTADLDDASQWFRYSECWDMENNRLYALAEGQDFDGFLLDEPYPEGVEDRPYSILAAIPIIAPEASPWPKPLCFDWLPIQQQYNILRQLQIEAGKRAARKVLYDANTFPDADEAQKFLSSAADMQGVKVVDVMRPPLVLGDGAQSIDVARNIPYLLSDWQRVTGASGTRLGDPDANTATEAVITEQAAGVRDSELRTLVQEWLTDAGQKMLQLVRQTLTLDIWVQLKDMDDTIFQEFLQSQGFRAYLGLRVGPEAVPQVLQMFAVLPGMVDQLKEQFGQLKPLKVSRQDLQMEADVVAVPSTIRPIYRAQLLQLINLLGPTALMSPTLLEELIKSFELPQAERIAEEITANLRQQAAMAQQLAQQKAMGAGGRPLPGQPTPQNGANPLGTQNPLGAVSGGMA
jgi:hypothetical protein